MRIRCYSVRLESLVRISDRAFKATSYDGSCDIEDIQWMDDASALDMAKALRKAGEFLVKSSRKP